MNRLPKDHPNVILVILDSARKDMFGCYGSSDGLTPNIDALAEGGLKLQDHYAAACGSAPAHVSIFSGQHPVRHKVLHNLSEMKNDLVAVPLLLRQLGYKCFGHCKASFTPPAGYEDLFGFDEMKYPGAGKTSARKSLRGMLADRLRGFPILYHSLKQLYEKFSGDEGMIRASAAIHDGRDSLNYLRHQLEKFKDREPIFAYTTLLHPHMPYCPPKSFCDRVFKGLRPHPLSFKIMRNIHAYVNGDFGPADEAMESVRKFYQADLLYVDHILGEFIKELNRRGILEHSILVVTSDHGEVLGEYGYLNHGNMVWEELLATPAIISAPGRLKEGMVISDLTSALDLMPTIFDLLGEGDWLREQTILDGKSVLSQGGEADNRFLVVDSPPAVLPERYKKYPRTLFELSIIRRAIRTASYKYIWQSDGRCQLYRTGDSELEENNLYTSKPQVATKMHEKMVRFYQEMNPSFQMDQYPVPLSKKVAAKMTDPRIRQELQRLGYL